MPQLNIVQGILSLLNFLLIAILVVVLINKNLKIKSPNNNSNVR